MLTSRKNNKSVKALSDACFARVKLYAKKYGYHSMEYKRAKFEYELAVRSADSREDAIIHYHCMDFEHDILPLFPRDRGGHCGATKRVHTFHPEGWELDFFAVKRFNQWGVNRYGNQLIAEIETWLKFENTPCADYLCPIFKYETNKSDKCKEMSPAMKEKVCIIAQKAIATGSLADMCEHAEYLNNLHGYHGESADARYQAIESFCESQDWLDIVEHPKNSGVIFDYAKGCYKAVIIDYAL